MIDFGQDRLSSVHKPDVFWFFLVLSQPFLNTRVGICFSPTDPPLTAADSDASTAVGGCQGCLPDPPSTGPDPCYDNSSDASCSSCAGGPVFCSQCCPTNFTEPYYAQHPEAYHAHPPVFLAQTSTSDAHADLCATRNYHETLQVNYCIFIRTTVIHKSEMIMLLAMTCICRAPTFDCTLTRQPIRLHTLPWAMLPCPVPNRSGTAPIRPWC